MGPYPKMCWKSGQIVWIKVVQLWSLNLSKTFFLSFWNCYKLLHYKCICLFIYTCISFILSTPSFHFSGLVSKPPCQDEAATEAPGPACRALCKKRQWWNVWESEQEFKTADRRFWRRALGETAGRRKLSMDKSGGHCAERAHAACNPEAGEVGEAGGAKLRGAPHVQHRQAEGQSQRARGRDPQHCKHVRRRHTVTNTGRWCHAQWWIVFLLPVCTDNNNKKLLIL